MHPPPCRWNLSMSGLSHASHEIDESFGQACAEYGVSGGCRRLRSGSIACFICHFVLVLLITGWCSA
jgi:hypothetical protein